MRTAVGIVCLRFGVLIWSSCLSVQIAAHAKTDRVTLYNGDNVTGEIISLESGVLYLATDVMGTVKIQWKHVASVTSDYQYEVRLTDGRRLFGGLQEAGMAGKVVFKGASEQQILGALDVVELRPIDGDVSERLDVYLSSNFSFTKASAVRQTELIGSVDYNDRNATTSLDGRLTLSATEESNTTSSRLNLARKAWTTRRNYFRELSLGYERNDELRLESRYTVGAGLGRFFIDTNRQRTSAAIGIQALTEQGFDGEQRSSLEAVLGGTVKSWRFDSPELDLNIDLALYPSLTEGGRLRAASNARLRWEMLDDVFWNLNAWGSYDNESVDEQGGQFDWGLTTGLGWSF